MPRETDVRGTSRAVAPTLSHTLTELRRLVRGSRRSARIPEVAPLIARLIGSCRTLAIERRPAGIAVRLQPADELSGEGLLTCVIHDAPRDLTAHSIRASGGR